MNINGVSPGSLKIPDPRPEQTSEKIRRWWRSVARAKKVLVGWGLFVGMVGTLLFLWVAQRGGTAKAYNILTQQQSPIDSDLGVPGMLLSSFGFFFAPAIIGALVGAAYASTSQLSARAVNKRWARIRAKLPRRSGKG